MPRTPVLALLLWSCLLPGGIIRGGDSGLVAVRVLGLLKLRQACVSAVSRPLRVSLGPAAAEEAQSISVRLDERGALCVRLDQGAEQKAIGLRIEPVDGGGTCRVVAEGIPEREYRGSLEITSGKGALRVVNRLPLGDHLAGVIGSEGGVAAPPEALKAQAVLARTFACRHRGRHGDADFCDTTHCQLYQGRASATPAVEEAVRATTGEILTWQGAPARAFYHSTCGGTTRPFSDAWGRPGPPYLGGVADGDACRESPHFRWEFRIGHAECMELLRAVAGGQPTALEVAEAGPGGWVRWLAVRQRDGSARRLRGEEFHSRAGRRLGWNAIRSACFTVRREGETWVFEGRGFGHGVGLCQWGTAGRARQGWDYTRILAFYFPGAGLQRN